MGLAAAKELRKVPILSARHGKQHNLSINSRFKKTRPKNTMRQVSQDVSSVEDDENDDGIPQIEEIEDVDHKHYTSA